MLFSFLQFCLQNWGREIDAERVRKRRLLILELATLKKDSYDETSRLVLQAGVLNELMNSSWRLRNEGKKTEALGLVDEILKQALDAAKTKVGQVFHAHMNYDDRFLPILTFFRCRISSS